MVNTNPLAHAEELFSNILQQDGTRLPGERRIKARERTAANGIFIPSALHQQILDYGKS